MTGPLLGSDTRHPLGMGESRAPFSLGAFGFPGGSRTSPTAGGAHGLPLSAGLLAFSGRATLWAQFLLR